MTTVKFQSEWGQYEVDQDFVVLDGTGAMRWAYEILVGELAYGLIRGCFGFRIQ